MPFKYNQNIYNTATWNKELAKFLPRLIHPYFFQQEVHFQQILVFPVLQNVCIFEYKYEKRGISKTKEKSTTKKVKGIFEILFNVFNLLNVPHPLYLLNVILFSMSTTSVLIFFILIYICVFSSFFSYLCFLIFVFCILFFYIFV